MDISKIEKWSPSSNIYDDLRGTNSLARPKVPSRTTSTIGYVSSRDSETLQLKRPTVSLILPTPPTTSSSEQLTRLDSILSMDDTKRLSLIESVEQEKHELTTNKDWRFIFEEKDPSCVCWTLHEIIQLICIVLFGCLIAMFIFTLIFYAFDSYWLEQPMINNSFWWLDDNHTNLTEFYYDTISTTEIIDYNDEY